MIRLRELLEALAREFDELDEDSKTAGWGDGDSEAGWGSDAKSGWGKDTDAGWRGGQHKSGAE